MKSDNFFEMKRCKMDWLDDIFWGTKDSQGIRNAVNAIKFVLFDDESVIPDGMVIGDKYEFISSRRDGRAKAKMLQPIDLVQILCTYAMQSFGLKHKKFDVSYEDYAKYRTKKIVDINLNKDFTTELVAYSLMDSIYGGYIFVSGNKYIKNILLDALISERYIDNKMKELDEFDGILKAEGIQAIDKKNFLNNFLRLDDDFLNIKRRDSEYLNYEESLK